MATKWNRASVWVNVSFMLFSVIVVLLRTVINAWTLVAVLCVVAPYIIGIFLMQTAAFRHFPLLALLVSIFIGAGGSYSYCDALIVRASGTSGIVLWQTPLLQSCVTGIGSRSLNSHPEPPEGKR